MDSYSLFLFLLALVLIAIPAAIRRTVHWRKLPRPDPVCLGMVLESWAGRRVRVQTQINSKVDGRPLRFIALDDEAAENIVQLDGAGWRVVP